MNIDNVKTAEVLDSVLQFVYGIFPQLNNDEYRYSRSFWMERMGEFPDLLLYAQEGPIICGSVFGFVENGSTTVGHCGVAGAYRGKGIGRALMIELERRVKVLGYHGITLGAVEGAEGFYEKLGYSGSLLIQSEEHSLDELKSLDTSYEVIGTNVYGGTVNQVWLRLPHIDRALQRKYEQTFPRCDTQMTFGKSF